MLKISQILPFLILLFIAVNAGVALDKKEQLLFHPETDPFAQIDHFDRLSEDDRNKHWNHGKLEMEDVSMERKLNMLREIDLNVHISVKLVGFSENGNMRIDIDEGDFSRLLDNLKTSGHINLNKVKPGQDHQLPVRVNYVFSVEHSMRKLVQDIQKAISSHLDKSDTNTVPFSVVDKVIGKDFEQMHTSSIAIYILNPKKVGEKELSYLYYEDSSPKPCGSAIWTSDNRYLWVDLTAGPMKLGPRTVGEGLVTEFSLPRINRYFTKKRKFMEHDFMSDLSIMVFHACEYLVNPSVDNMPLPLSFESPKLHLQLIIVHDDVPEEEDVNWIEITEQLQSLKLLGQSYYFSKHRISLVDCKACTRAYSLAMKSYTSPIRKHGLSAYIHQYIDSVDMHYWMGKVLPDISQLLNTRYHPMETTIPVFVFSLKSDDVILLDRFHSAMAFRDMIIAIQTRAGSVVQDFHCDGRSITTEANGIQRDLLGAVLTGIYGVMPSYNRWSNIHGSVSTEFLWSSSNTPFGPFSASNSLSFSQSDSAKRNVVFSFMHRFIEELNTTLGHFSSKAYSSQQFDLHMTHHDLSVFLDRWDVIQVKLKAASSALSLHNYDHALWWARSVYIDLRSIHVLVHEVGSKVRSYIDCTVQDSVSFSKLVRYLGVFCAACLVFYGVRSLLKGTKVKSS